VPSGNTYALLFIFFVSLAVLIKVDKALQNTKDGPLKTMLAWGGAILFLAISGSAIALIVNFLSK